MIKKPPTRARPVILKVARVATGLTLAAISLNIASRSAGTALVIMIVSLFFLFGGS